MSCGAGASSRLLMTSSADWGYHDVHRWRQSGALCADSSVMPLTFPVVNERHVSDLAGASRQLQGKGISISKSVSFSKVSTCKPTAHHVNDAAAGRSDQCKLLM